MLEWDARKLKRNMEAIQYNLKSIRAVLDLTQDELGKVFGITGGSLCNLENGHTKFTEIHYFAFMYVLNKAIEQLRNSKRNPEADLLYDMLHYKVRELAHGRTAIFEDRISQ